jgi:16S rRNA (cytosine967-C5)-methyltransferase
MTPSARLSAVVELLDINFEITGRAEQSVATYFRNRRFAGSKDRRWITEQFYQILRRLGEIDWIAEQLKLEVTSRSRAIISLMLFQELSTAEISDSYFIGSHAQAAPEAAELEALSGFGGLELTQMPVAARANFPIWMQEKLQATYGERTHQIVQAYAVRAPATLRINPLTADRDNILSQLKEAGINAEATDISPLGIRLEKPQNLAANALFKDGFIEVQDEAAQISALLASADMAAGSTVVDYCAGGGGKTLVLAASLENNGQLHAMDVDRRRMKDITHRCKRAGITNVQQHVLPQKGETLEILDSLKGAADLVYVDAPCSGSGTWRRQPEQKWFLNEAGLEEYATLQSVILNQACDYVKVGGRLVYATCSLFTEENQQQIDSFLAENTDFERVDIATLWQKAGLGGDAQGQTDLQITPEQFGADGFYTAVLQRKA